jgi:putative membrane protein
MKNLIISKSKLLLSLCIAGSMFLVVSCSENRTTNGTNDGTLGNDDRSNTGQGITGQGTANNQGNRDNTAIVVDNNSGQKFLMEASKMQHEEIALGRLAQQRGTSQHVKDLGNMMVQDHTKTLSEIQTLAQSQSITIPSTLENSSVDGYDKLSDKTGNDFDKSYTDLMVKHHKDAIDKFEKAAENTENSEVAAWARQKLPGLRTHLQHAETAKKRSDGSGS